MVGAVRKRRKTTAGAKTKLARLTLLGLAVAGLGGCAGQPPHGVAATPGLLGAATPHRAKYVDIRADPTEARAPDEGATAPAQADDSRGI